MLQPAFYRMVRPGFVRSPARFKHVKQRMSDSMEKPFNFPEVRNYIECHHVNGTPDGEYALRILEHYRQCCDTVWKVDGLSKNERVIYEYMNECQKRRAEELDRAIQILRSHTN
jgi:hypothetical protein